VVHPDLFIPAVAAAVITVVVEVLPMDTVAGVLPISEELHPAQPHQVKEPETVES
jgi:hypothetical protein